MVQWTQALEFSPRDSLNDQLAVLCARVPTLRCQFRSKDVADEELVDTALVIETDPPASTSDGYRILQVDHNFHLDSLNLYSSQLQWLLGKLDYIGRVIGLGWAAGCAAFLRGDFGVSYNLTRLFVRSTPASFRGRDLTCFCSQLNDTVLSPHTAISTPDSLRLNIDHT